MKKLVVIAEPVVSVRFKTRMSFFFSILSTCYKIYKIPGDVRGKCQKIKLIGKPNYSLACTKHNPNFSGPRCSHQRLIVLHVSFGMDRFIIAFDPR